METIIKPQIIGLSISSKLPKVKTNNFWQQTEEYRFGIIPLLLVVVVCMGGIAAGFSAKTDFVKLCLITFPTIITLAFTLAVAPMRWIIWSAAIAVLIQLAVIII